MEGMWAIVELMGHVRIAGYVTEEEHFGAKMGRIDIHAKDKVVTQFFGGSSVYRITPVTEEIAKGVAEHSTPAPVSSWELPESRRISMSDELNDESDAEDEDEDWQP